jgi:PKD repeat protein
VSLEHHQSLRSVLLELRGGIKEFNCFERNFMKQLLPFLLLVLLVACPNPDPTPTNRAPVAQFSLSSSTANINVSLSFNASASSDPDGDALTYAWDFGDGQNASGVSATHAFAVAGDFNVKLTVSDGKLENFTTKKVTISSVIVTSDWRTLFTGVSTESLQRLNISSNAKGDAAAIWQEAYGNISVIVYSATSNSWGAITQFDMSGKIPTSIRVKVLADGSVLALWHEQLIADGTINKWRYSRFSSGAWSVQKDAAVVDPTLTGAGASEPDVLVNTAGQIAFSWLANIVGSDVQGFVTVFNPTTQLWSTQRLGGRQTGVIKLALDESGHLTALYGAQVNLKQVTQRNAVFASRYDFNSSNWGTVQEVLDTQTKLYTCFTVNQPCYAVSRGANGKVVAVFSDGASNGIGTITTRVFDPINSVWNTLTDGVVATDAGLAFLESDGGGNVMVAYYKPVNAKATTQSRRLSANALTWETPQILNNFTANTFLDNSFARAQLQVNKGGEALLSGVTDVGGLASAYSINLGTAWQNPSYTQDYDLCNPRDTRQVLDDQGVVMMVQICLSKNGAYPMSVRAKRVNIRQ